MLIKQTVLAVSVLVMLYCISPVQANFLPDTDRDGVPDNDEIYVYGTDPAVSDSDADGYSDFDELAKGYAPLSGNGKKLENSDFDKDGLSDKLELSFKTDPRRPDSDRDGFSDYDEVMNGYDPLFAGIRKIEKLVVVDSREQELDYRAGGVVIEKFKVSTGVPKSPTPKGVFTVTAKAQKAWSRYGLWMPNWLGLGSGKFGIHELPIWPDGRREGESHLGKPASHGCIRLGRDDSRVLYEFAELGTKVIIK